MSYSEDKENHHTIETDQHGQLEYRYKGKLHREDGPAIERPNGYKAWYKNGQLHREDGPAVAWVDGKKQWYLNGLCHREDGPAIIYPDGTKIWYLNGHLYTTTFLHLSIQ